jgi:hypothetical protein
MPVAVCGCCRGDVVAGSKPHVFVERDELNPGMARDGLTRTVSAGVVDNQDSIGRPSLCRQRRKCGFEVRAGVPIDDEHGNAHGIIILRAQFLLSKAFVFRGPAPRRRGRLQ